MPNKKGFVPGVSTVHLDEGYCRTVVAALNRLLELGNCRGLHLGAGGGAIPKYLHHFFPQSRHVLVDISKSVLLNCQQYFDWPKEDPRFQPVQDEACAFMQKQKESEFDYIIVDISNDEAVEDLYPPQEFLEPKFVQLCLGALKEDGVLVYNTIALSERKESNHWAKVFSSFKEVGFLYQSKLSAENVLFFAVKSQPAIEERQGEEVVVVRDAMGSGEGEWEWEEEELKSVELVQPSVVEGFLGRRVVLEGE
jgi:spermidine synthase